MNMTKNIGKTDRTVRIVAGLALVLWGVLTHNWLGAIGLVPLATALIGWCPAYLLVGVDTCKTGK